MRPWEAAPLEKLCVLGPQYGANAKAVPPSGLKPRYIRITDITQEGDLLAAPIVEADASNSEPYELEDGDVLFARSGATVGKTYLHEEANGPSIFAGYLIRFRPDRSLLDPRFLFYFTKSARYSGWVESKRRVAAQPNINGAEYASLRIPLPPLSEQRRIVELLDHADHLRRLRTEASTNADRILPALFLKMFGDPATNPMGWPTAQLGDVLVNTQYGTSTRANTRGVGTPVIRMNNIDPAGHLDLSDLKHVELAPADEKRQLLSDGDLLFNRTNSRELVGKTGLWDGSIEAVAASYLIRARVDSTRALPEFIWAYMNSSFMKRVLLDKARRAIGMANINAKELRGLPVPVPPLRIQAGFVTRVKALAELRRNKADGDAALVRLFSVLISQAFSGALTSTWREVHTNGLLQEMERRACARVEGE